MKSSKRVIFPLLIFMVLAGCGGSGGGSGSPAPPVAGPPVAGNNVMSVTVNGSLCSGNTSNVNTPCVSVTVCSPGTTICQTINDIILDTGSYGLRIFRQALNVPLSQVSNSSGSIAECIVFGDGSALWGPVQTASVVLGNETAVEIPIQVADVTFGSLPGVCKDASAGPSNLKTQYNGVLGVGLFAQDCGTACVNSANVGMYYACNGTSCNGGTAVPLASQVINPVAALPGDNNGVIVQLPSLQNQGGVASSASGSLILGIGTQSNNMPSGVTAYGADQVGELTTTFNGTQYAGFLDTGSNGLFFPSPSTTQLPACTKNPGWYCPPTVTNLAATNTGVGGSPSGIVSFLIGNADSLFDTSNQVFSDLGGSAVNSFDWGLPFFFGRSVFVGINGTSTSLGTGPYWAY